MKKIIIVLISSLLILFTSCTSINKKIEINEITNHVTNEINEVTTSIGELNINDLDTLITTSVEKVSKAVIGVTNKIKVTYQVEGVDIITYDPVSFGSAVIYKRIENYDGTILSSYTYYAYTNEHVIESNDDLHQNFVYIQDNALEIPAHVLGKDKKLDLAVISFDTYLYIEPVEVGDSDLVKKGTFAYTVGNPSGYTYYGTATLGVVSNTHILKSFDTDNDGINDFVSEFLQTDAAVNPGNSGGGLFTLDGKLIGINSLKLVSSDIEGMAFSIPSNIVKYVAENYLEENKEIIRPKLGVTGIAVRNMYSSALSEYGISSWPNIYEGENPYGVYVISISDGSLVSSSVKAGDILLQLDDIKLYSNNDISGNLNRVDLYQVGDIVNLTYYSSEEKMVKTIEVTLKK